MLHQVEAELAMRIEEQDKTIRQKNKVIENRDSTIEQLHRRLEFAMPTSQPVDNTKLEEENLRLTETLERERDLWHCKQSELEASLEFRYCFCQDHDHCFYFLLITLVICMTTDEDDRE